MIWLFVGLAAAGIALLIWLDNIRITVSRHTLAADCDLRLVHLSDLHSFRGTDRLLKRVRGEQPGLIVVTGDLWDRSKLDVERMLGVMHRLCEIAETVYVPGNHEYNSPRCEEYFAKLAELGVHVLRSRSEELCGIHVLGLDHLRYAPFSPQELSRLCERDGFRLAAVHYPEFFESLYAQYPIDLVLSGHAHGGQFRIPFAHRGIYSPDQGLFPKYTEGLHTVNGVHMIVSRGIGNSRFPFRLFNPPELISIRLKKH